MKYIYLFFLALLFSCSSRNEKPAEINIIPQPNKIVQEKGMLKIDEKADLSVNNEKLLPFANLFIEQLKQTHEIQISEDKNALISLQLLEPLQKWESYILQISKRKIEISAHSVNGIFNGLQSLRQLILFADRNENGIYLPVVTINDEPRFGWRGLMLDESRHFFGAEKVKEILDLMALHKLNVFHWHLTDVPGWRIEIKKYPKLTETGGRGNYTNPNAPVRFYTQDEIREIVNYASARCIEIIPEVDMPGHAAAANRAYPEYSGGGSEKYPEFTFNPGKEETYTYLTNILRETANLFPSDYIHLGGDEVHFGNENWKNDPDVQHLMKQQNLPDLKSVETYFVRRMADSIRSLGKKVAGWDEIVDHGLNPETSLVMWWRHNMPEKLAEALEKNYNIVLCPRIPLYFDFVQYNSHEWGRKWGGAFASLDLVYHFPPDTLPGFNKYYDQISGLQANVWTERIQNNKRLDFMLNPRLSALAEAAWTTPENKNFADFEERLKKMVRYFDSENIYYFNPFQQELNPEPAGPLQTKN